MMDTAVNVVYHQIELRIIIRSSANPKPFVCT